jgi:hypothetical protein
LDARIVIDFTTAAQRSALALAVLFPFAVAAQTYERATDIFAVTVPADETGDRFKSELVRFLEIRKVTAVQALKTRDRTMLLFKATPGAGLDKFREELGHWVSLRESVDQPLVLIHGRSYAIPTGMIMIQFRTGISLDEARVKLKDFGLGIVQEPSALRPTRFVVKSEEAPNADPIALARRIKADPSILNAEPDLLVVEPKSPAHQ